MAEKESVAALRATESRSNLELLDAAADLIGKLAGRCSRYAEELAVAQERTRWIPVTERLPEDFRKVLCWGEYFRYGDFNAMFADYALGYQITGNWGGEVTNGTKARALAWIPLPEPPEEVE